LSQSDMVDDLLTIMGNPLGRKVKNPLTLVDLVCPRSYHYSVLLA
jgi:hypothetical protein